MSRDHGKKFHIKVYGCQMNVYDGDRLRNAMISSGWTETSEIGDCDFAIFITCSIRDKAEQKVVSELGRFKDNWRTGGRPRIALLGCMAQRIGDGVAKKFPWVRVVGGPRHLGSIPQAIADSLEGGELIVLLDDDPNAIDDLSCAPLPAGNPHKAYVTIAHGCDQFCSYCIVPHVRGRFGSRRPEAIISEIEELAARGVVETTLIGQNVNTYGKDIGYSFSRLLSDVASIDGIARVRFVTSHPVDFGDDIIETMAATPKICPSINLPVQAGSDKVLLEMNRKYTRSQYLAVVAKIRDALPGCGLTTDLIVGFPGETEAEFEESVSLLEEVRFDLVHSAAYSPREGTPAASRCDQIPGNERARRLNKLNAIQSKISASINKSLEGQIFEVLLDEPAPKGEGLLQGRTATDKVVLVAAPEGKIGTFQNVRITGSSPWCLDGEII